MEPAAVPAVMSAVLPAVGLAEVGGLAKEEASREGWVLSGLTHAHRIQKKSPMGTSGFTSGINTSTEPLAGRFGAGRFPEIFLP